MSYRVSASTLNASTLDILNVIRQNASYDYQASVPEVTQYSDIPKVGEIIYGTPAFANQFINALINRIALVRVKGATFNNPYSILKKGYLEFGETIEEIFVNIAKVVEFNPEKGEEREFRRTLPDVRSAFHVMNWRVMYPVTIQDEDLRQAFMSADGVTNLIAKIVDSVYTAAEYDEFLLFKYLLIKNISSGGFYPVGVDTDDTASSAIAFRGISNILPFMKTDYNAKGVKTTTPKDRQIIFMDAMFNAKFDVEVLASAFNMDKADFMGRLFLIDDFTTFDNDRFEVIRAHSDGLEEVTDDELSLLADVQAVILDDEWFQIYDNNNKFTEKYVASGLYWNYFYHTWKTVSVSPFSNAVVFVNDTATISLPDSVTVEIASVDVSEEAVAMALVVDVDDATFSSYSVVWTQTEAMTEAGIAITTDGALYIPADAVATEISLEFTINGTTYYASTTITGASTTGTTISFTTTAV